MKYRVHIAETTIRHATVEVEAESQEAAEDIASNMEDVPFGKPDYDWNITAFEAR
jgi:hypothetical protein